MQAFTTRGMPARRKAAYWNSLSNESFAAMDVSPRDVASFDGELRREPIGSLTLLDVHSAAVHIRHSRSHIARTKIPSYLLLTPLRGNFELRVSGTHALRVAKDDYCLLDHADPYELVHGDDVRVLCLDIPRGILDSLLAHPEDAVGRIVRPQGGLPRVLLLVLRELGASIQPIARSCLGSSVAQGLLGFITAAYSEEIPTPRSAQFDRQRAVVDCIEARLHEQSLSPVDIANDVGLSTRRVRALLAADGLSFSSFVLRRRLERCAALLIDSRWRSRSITDIAFLNGFNNVTHFGYAFKKHFGQTPSQRRADATPR